MSDEEQKKVSSDPPPTDEIDGDWGATPTPPPPIAAAKPQPPAKPSPAATSPVATSQDDDEDEDDDDDDDDDEDEDEDDDEEDRVRSARPVSRTAVASGESSDWLPDWAPWAVLGGLILIGVIGGLGGIGDIASTPVEPAKASTTAEAAAPAPSPVRPARPAMPLRPTAGAEESVEASHLLVSYQGALRADPKITRNKAQAKQRAEEALAKAKKGTPFKKLVAEYSDEPRAAERGGSLGSFTRGRMVKPFADAAFAIKPNELSGVVETAFGYHVILRTK